MDAPVEEKAGAVVVEVMAASLRIVGHRNFSVTTGESAAILHKDTIKMLPWKIVWEVILVMCTDDGGGS